MAGDVLSKEDGRAGFNQDAADVGPEVAGIVFAFASAAEGEGLTGISGRDDMNLAAPRSAVEGSQIVPNRRVIQGLVFHPGHESGRGETVSLDKTHSSIAGFGKVDAEVETSDTGTEGKPAQELRVSGGMWSHIRTLSHHGLAAWVKGSEAASGCSGFRIGGT